MHQQIYGGLDAPARTASCRVCVRYADKPSEQELSMHAIILYYAMHEELDIADMLNRLGGVENWEHTKTKKNRATASRKRRRTKRIGCRLFRALAHFVSDYTQPYEWWQNVELGGVFTSHYVRRLYVTHFCARHWHFNSTM